MAECRYCKQDMADLKTRTCTANQQITYPDGISMTTVPFSADPNVANKRCHDCGIFHGGKHHPGCDVERCPRCGHQLIGCDCLNDDEFPGIEDISGLAIEPEDD